MNEKNTIRKQIEKEAVGEVSLVKDQMNTRWCARDNPNTLTRHLTNPEHVADGCLGASPPVPVIRHVRPRQCTPTRREHDSEPHQLS